MGFAPDKPETTALGFIPDEPDSFVTDSVGFIPDNPANQVYDSDYDIKSYQKMAPALKAFGKSTAGEVAGLPSLLKGMHDMPGNMIQYLVGGLDMDEKQAGRAQAVADVVSSFTSGAAAIGGLIKRSEIVPVVKEFNKDLEEFSVRQIKESEEIQNRYSEEKESIVSLFKQGRKADVVNKVSEMAIFEAPRLALQALIAYFSGGASLGYMGTSAASRKYASLADEELLPQYRTANAIGTGLTEFFSERLGTGRVLDKAFKKQLQKGAANKVKELMIDALAGAVSEGVAQVGENMLDQAVGMDADLGGGVAEALILGALFDGGTSIAGQINNARHTRKFRSGLIAFGATDAEADSIIESSQAARTDSERNEVDKRIKEVMDRTKNDTEQNIGIAIDIARAEEILAQENISESDREELNDITERIPAIDAYEIKQQMEATNDTERTETVGTEQEAAAATEGGTEAERTDTAVQDGAQEEPGAAEEGVGEGGETRQPVQTSAITEPIPVQVYDFLSEEERAALEERDSQLSGNFGDTIETVAINGKVSQRPSTYETSELVQIVNGLVQTITRMRNTLTTIDGPLDRAILARNIAERLHVLQLATKELTNRGLDVGAEIRSLTGVNKVVEGTKKPLEKKPEATEVPVQEQAEGGEEAGQAQGQERPIVDQAELKEAMESDGGDARPEPTPTPSGRVVGISKAWDKIESDIPFDEDTLNPQRVAQTETIKAAFDKKLHEKTDIILNKIKKRRGVNSEEIGALLIRKTELVSESRRLRTELSRAHEAGDMQLAADLAADLDMILDQAVKLTDAIRKGATETARTLAAMAMKMDAETYDLVNIVAYVESVKGKKMDKRRKEKVAELVDELDAVEGDLSQLEYPTASAYINELMILDEVERAYRRVKKPGKKRADIHADSKLLRKRQDEIFKLIDQINNGRAKDNKIKKERPDSAGYLEMIENLRTELAQKEAGDRKVQRNIKLIEKRDALLSEIENMHRDVREKTEKLRKSKLEKDIALYDQAKRDQDLIASLLEQIRGDVESGTPVLKEDVFGYKQTIANLRKELANKKIADQIRAKITALEKAVESGDTSILDKQDAPKSKNQIISALKSRQKSLERQLENMREREQLINEVETLSRRIRDKKARGEDVNADLKLIKRRQDQIIEVIDEINNRRPAGEKISKEQQPDSEGYLEMLQTLRAELNEVRKSRRLDDKIAQLERDIQNRDVAKYDIRKKPTAEARDILLKRARAKALKEEINRIIAMERPKTILGYVNFYVWDPIRNLKLSVDEGHILRQGAFFMSDWKNWVSGDAQSFVAESFKALFKNNADILQARMMSDVDYNTAKLAKLALIEEGDYVDARDEILMEGALTHIKGIGKLQQAFGRAQITGTNYLRFLWFKRLLAESPNASLSQQKDMARIINIFTGRGATVKDPNVKRALDAIFTSASFTTSRFQTPFLLSHRGTDGKLLWQNKELRKHILNNYANFIFTRMGIMAMLAAAIDDVEIGDEEDHWTYGRLIVYLPNGNARVYDPWAGISSAYRAIFPAAEGKFGETIGKLFEGRKHPALTAVQEVGFGKTYYGADIDRKAAVVRNMLPISVDGVREAIVEDTGVFDVIVATAADVHGIGSFIVPERELRKSLRKARRE